MTRLLILALAVLAAPAWSQTALEPIASAVRAQALSLPAQTPVVALSPSDPAHPRQTYTIQRTFASDGGFTVAWTSATVQSSQSFRPNGTLVSSLIKDSSLGASVETKVDPGRTSVKTVIVQDGKVKSDKKSTLKPSILLRDELQHLILQAWQYGVRDGLKFQSLSPDGGMVGDFQIVFRTVADPTSVSNKYTYPEEFRAAFQGSNDYVIADMSLGGVGSLFFPHHFYLVYRPVGSGLDWVAYFGEDPKKPAFQYRAK